MDKRDELNEKTLTLHRKYPGKISVQSTVPLENREDLSLAYTPGVGHVSSIIGKDKERVREYTIKANSVAIVSDGSAILGLGNLGPEAALPVMEGKAVLFKEFGGIDAFPICLATQDTDEIVKTVENIAPVFGGINLEDISAPRCFEIEERLKGKLDIPVMHDDQHGTAVVVLAGLLNTLRVRGMNKESVKIVISGAGAAGIAVTKLLLQYGFEHIVVLDSKGIIHEGRSDLGPYKGEIAHATHSQKEGGLTEALPGADVFIGVSKGGILTRDMVTSMNQSPVIFALANPVPEIMPEEASAGGAGVIATGRSDFPNQVNNVLAFPGIFRGALDHRVRDITDAMLIRAAEALATTIPDPQSDLILPNVFEEGIAERIAKAII